MKIIKIILLKSIRLYQNTPSSWHNMCRHYPTCSEYTYQAIDEYGIIKGLFLGTKRILKCNPLNKQIYDPLPQKKENKK